MYLSADRCTRLEHSLSAVLDKKKVTRHELEKLLGRLNWAARVVHGGFTFMRSLISCMAKAQKPKPGHFCSLSVETVNLLLLYHGETSNQ